MLCLLYLWAILLIVLAHGKDDDNNNCPLYKYFTLNTLLPLQSFSFSCYGIESSCDVYYTPPGSGCKTDLLELVGTVLQNETKVLTFNTEIALGGGFCSDNQIGVFHVGKIENDDITIHLPRATQAGTKFHLALPAPNSDRQCRFFALSAPAKVTINNDGVIEVLTIDAYGFQLYKAFQPDAIIPLLTTISIVSDNPIIASCFRSNVPILVATLQPITRGPLLAFTGLGSSYFSVIASNCSTNELIPDYSLAKIHWESEPGDDCSYIGQPQLTMKFQIFGITGSCIFYVDPRDNVCFSATTIENDYGLLSFGIPESKFSTRFGNYPAALDDVNFLSFSETTCTGYVNGNQQQNLTLEWAGPRLLNKVSFGTWTDIFNQFSWLSCVDPVLVVSRGESFRIAFFSGYQAEDLWQPFFESECSEPFTKSPSSSNARSFISFMNRVVFLGFFIFSS